MSSQRKQQRGASSGTLHRRLGLWSTTLSGIGVILGAGVYALVGPAAGQAGGALWLAFIAAGSVAGLTAYSYARFVAIRPKNSPEFQYVSLAFGPRMGFASGWVMAWADLISVAAVALGFGGYLAHLLPLPVALSALMLLAALAAVAYRGISESVGLVVTFTLVELAGLLFIIAVGLPSWGNVDYLEMPQGMGGLWTAAALVFFAYLGFDELGNLAEESVRPERTLPLALLWSMVISTLVYVAVAVSAVSAVGWQALSGSQAPLAVVAGKVLGPRADQALTLIALAATANTVLLLLVAASRSLHAMSRAKALPAWLAVISRRQTPWAAIAVASFVGAAFVLVGSLERVAQMTNAAILISFITVNLGLFWWNYRAQTQWTLQRALTGILPPLVATGACAWLLLYTGAEAIGLALLLSGAGLMLGWRLGKTPAEG